MRNNNFSQHQTQTLVAPPASGIPVHPTEAASGFLPTPEEISNIAYFAFLNHGSLPGHDIQHWLEAEAKLITCRNLTRVHGFHNKS